MRKIFLIVLTLTFLLTLSSAAFAGQSDTFVFYGNSQVGSISNGYQGYSWNHSGSDREVTININKILDRYYQSWNNKKISWRHIWNNNRNAERYFYVDANGVNHYFYLDPDRDYEVRQYVDKYGVTQFAFVAKGWK
ncbi:hypothetical protein Psch_00571 [Pelotomaculum schinkii]|uniref:Uncharacterized protein n=1 Tax=Pelotomaculum schinkii TaxID=78350 RepID=A0A4Y7RE58_9FIRM|nr:hypothetical protein [Pelotomaculum schinkii]TEB07030.1 hypothetical protein Psch_00571 [Pelotomaculum schinkii]